MRRTKNEKFIIYQAIFPNGKYYIGLTSRTFRERQREHFSVAKRGGGHLLHAALRKYKNIKWEILEKDLTLEKANQMEQFYIKMVNSLNPNGYNQTEGGLAQGSLSEDTRMRMSKSKLGHKHSAETKRKIGNAHKGRSRPEKQKLKQAISMGGKPFLVFDRFSGNLIGEWKVVRKCARELGVDASNLSSCLKDNSRYLKNFTFRYK